jgi:hypothetical protein
MLHSKVIKELVARADKKVKTSSIYFGDKLQVDELNRLGTMVEALENLSVNPNPKSTPQAHKLMMEEKSKQLLADVDRAEMSIMERLGRTYEEVLPKAYEEAGYRASQYAPEIRNSLKGLPKGERLQAIQTAIQSKKGDVIHAIQGAPELLTGLTDAEAKKALNDYLDKHSPTFHKQMRTSESLVLEEGLNILKQVRISAKEGFDSNEIQKIKEAEAQHQKDYSSFESARATPIG